MELNLQNLITWIFAFTCKPEITKFVPAPLLVGIELNPGPGRGEDLPESDRWRIVFLKKENGLNPTQIAKKIPCSRPTVYEVFKLTTVE